MLLKDMDGNIRIQSLDIPAIYHKPTDVAIHWVLNELSRDINKADMDQINYLYNLGRVLVKAEPGLMLQHKGEIMES